MMTATHDSRVDPACRDVLDEIEAHVQCCLGSRIRGFEIVLKDGGLVLQGQTHTYYAKQMAQSHVLEVTDLPILANDIEVI